MVLINGSTFDDILFGTPGGDFIFGFGGNDQLYGRAGPDILIGGSGDDMLDGGADFSLKPKRTAFGFTDELHGGPGRDVLHIGPGGYSNGDSNNDGTLANDVKYADITVIHQGGPRNEAARINQFDFKGHGSASLVQDKILLASGEDVDFVKWILHEPRKIAADGSWSGTIDQLRLIGGAGEIVLINPDDRHGRLHVHSDDGTWKAAIDYLMDIVRDEWLLP